MQPAELSVVRAGRRRDHGAAHDRRLFHVPNGGARITPTLIDPHPGPYGRPSTSTTARSAAASGQVAEPARAHRWFAGAAGLDPMTRLSDHLNDGGRGSSAHRDRGSRKSGKPVPARPAPPMTKGRVVRPASPPDLAVRRYMGYDKAAPSRPRRHRRASPRPVVKEFSRWRSPTSRPCRSAFLRDKLIALTPRAERGPGPGTGKALLRFKPGPAPSRFGLRGRMGIDQDGRSMTVGPERSARCARETGGLIDARRSEDQLPRRFSHPAKRRGRRKMPAPHIAKRRRDV